MLKKRNDINGYCIVKESNLKVVVEAAITVETMLFIWSMVGVEMRSRSSAITVNAVLSST